MDELAHEKFSSHIVGFPFLYRMVLPLGKLGIHGGRRFVRSRWERIVQWRHDLRPYLVNLVIMSISPLTLLEIVGFLRIFQLPLSAHGAFLLPICGDNTEVTCGHCLIRLTIREMMRPMQFLSPLYTSPTLSIFIFRVRRRQGLNWTEFPFHRQGRWWGKMANKTTSTFDLSFLIKICKTDPRWLQTSGQVT